MRIRILLIALIGISFGIKAQNYTPLSYSFNGTPTNGIKIKTNLPYQSSAQMPTIIIEGYNYGKRESIGIILNWYIYAGNFYAYTASSHGAYTPTIKLANENGKVIIYIDSREYFNRFQIRAYAKGMSQDIATNYQGWTAVDEPLTGTNVVTIQYKTTSTEQSIWTENGTDINYNKGNVGIGTTSPSSQLHIASDKAIIKLQNTTHEDTENGFYGWLGGYDKSGDEIWWVGEGSGGGKALGLYTNRDGYDLNIMNKAKGMTIKNNGDIGIGTRNPDAKLAVNGNIHTKEVRVNLTGWPDYVFEEAYNLPTLLEVEKHIKEKGHLKDIPSAKEVEKNGVFIGEMNSKLLQKIEELTLYTIAQETQLEDQQKELESQKEMNSNLETRLHKLEQLVNTLKN